MSDPATIAPITGALSSADRKAPADEARVALWAARPKPLELQQELTSQQRQELATEKYLLDGFFKAKLQNADVEFDLTDVQMLRNLQAVGRHLCDRNQQRLDAQKEKRT